MTMGERIKSIREEKGISQRDLQDRISKCTNSTLDFTAISRYENNRVKRISVQQIAIVCKGLGVTLSEFFEGVDVSV